MSAIDKRVKEIVAEQLGVDESQVTNEASFMDDLGADSLELVEITMALEERFNLTVPDDEADRLKTVGDVLEALAKLLGEPGLR